MDLILYCILSMLVFAVVMLLAFHGHQQRMNQLFIDALKDHRQHIEDLEVTEEESDSVDSADWWKE